MACLTLKTPKAGEIGRSYRGRGLDLKANELVSATFQYKINLVLVFVSKVKAPDTIIAPAEVSADLLDGKCLQELTK